MADSDVSA